MLRVSRSFADHLSRAWWRASVWIGEHKRLVSLALVVVIFLVPHITHASFWDWFTGPSAILKGVFAMIVWIVSKLVELLGQLFIYFVDIFLGFARYNSFGDALPVKVGWVIVRDVCNMFFIVILLVSAFSTIIGWDSSLRYNQVLPKLLLMAVLINFSKTLIQLLIDFSQVIMLTFVNAFAATGAGNFVEAFKIHDLLQARASTDQQSASLAIDSTDNLDVVSQIFVSYLLALMMIVIANGVMIILIAYILFRIVGLWMALMLAPAAFFMIAVPGRFQKSLSGFTTKYWGKLGAMLSGGPIIAFFLYLTFAILQDPSATCTPTPTPSGAAAGGTVAPATPPPTPADCGLAGKLKLYDAANLERPDSLQTFLTRVGDSGSVASFIVATAMMFFALETATEVAGQVDKSLGEFAGKVGGVSKALAVGAATIAATSPFLAAKAGYGIADRRLDMTGWASKQGLRTLGRVPILGKYLRKPLVAGMMMNKRKDAAEGAEAQKMIQGMSADQKRITKSTYASFWKPWMPYASTQEQKGYQAIALDLTSDAVMVEEKKRISDELEDRIQKQNPDMPFEEVEKRAEIATLETITRRVNEALEDADKIAKISNDVVTRQKIKERRNTDPAFYGETRKIEKIHQGTTNAAKAALWTDLAKSRGEILSEMLLYAGACKKDEQTGKVTMEDDVALGTLLDRHRNNPLLVENLKYLVETVRHSPNGMDHDVLKHSMLGKDWNGEQHLYNAPKISYDLAGRIGEKVGLGRALGTPTPYRPGLSSILLSGEHMHYGTEKMDPALLTAGEEIHSEEAEEAIHSFEESIHNGTDFDQAAVEKYFSSPVAHPLPFLALDASKAHPGVSDPERPIRALRQMITNRMNEAKRLAALPTPDESGFRNQAKNVLSVVSHLQKQGIAGKTQEDVAIAAIEGGVTDIFTSKARFMMLAENERRSAVKFLNLVQGIVAGYATAGKVAPQKYTEFLKSIRDSYTGPGGRENVANVVRNAMERSEPPSTGGH